MGIKLKAFLLEKSGSQIRVRGPFTAEQARGRTYWGVVLLSSGLRSSEEEEDMRSFLMGLEEGGGGLQTMADTLVLGFGPWMRPRKDVQEIFEKELSFLDFKS